MKKPVALMASAGQLIVRAPVAASTFIRYTIAAPPMNKPSEAKNGQ